MTLNQDTRCERSKHELIIRGMSESGEIALCCKQQHPLSLKDQDMSDVQKIRDDLSNGIRNIHCTSCWQHEDRGILSWRQRGNMQHDANPKAEQTIELYLNNTCDLKCIYCSPKYSSKWVQEINANKKVLSEFVNEVDYPAGNYDHLDKTLSLIEEIGATTDIGTVTQLAFLGGEPLLTPMIKKNIINEVITAFYKKADRNCQLRLGIVTNCNTPDDILDSMLKTLQDNKKLYPELRVFVSVSLESIGEMTEFLRYGSSFDQVDKNLRKWLHFIRVEYPMYPKIAFSMSVNIVSWANTCSFIKYGIALSKEFDIAFRFGVNTVMYPRHLSLAVLDMDEHGHVFTDIKNLLLEYKEWSDSDGKDPWLVDVEASLLQVEQAKKDFAIASPEQKRILANTALRYFEYLADTRGTHISSINPKLFTYLQKVANEKD